LPARRPPDDLAKAKARIGARPTKSRLRAKSAVRYDGRAVAFGPTEASKAEGLLRPQFVENGRVFHSSFASVAGSEAPAKYLSMQR
jgi:hypothetical protein